MSSADDAIRNKKAAEATRSSSGPPMIPRLLTQQRILPSPSGGKDSAVMSTNWEPLRQRLVGQPELKVSMDAASELLARLESVKSSEFPLMLSALLPAVSSVLASKTRPTNDTTSLEHQIRSTVLEWIAKLPNNEQLRPHAPHLVAVAMDVLTRDFEENAVSASRILFDLYKTYRTLPTDYVQPYLDFVIALYRNMPTAVQRNFSMAMLVATMQVPAPAPAPSAVAPAKTATATTDTTTATTTTNMSPGSDNNKSDAMDIDGSDEKAEHSSGTKKDEDQQAATNVGMGTPVPATTATSSAPAVSSSTLAAAVKTNSTPSSTSVTLTTSQPQPQAPPPRLLLKSNLSFRVLTECPLVVMLMFQLYPKFMKTNISVLINVMMEVLTLRPPSVQSVFGSPSRADNSIKRLYLSRGRELVAAQAKTLSFLTYLLRTFSKELKPYEDRLAANVITLMSTCPREAISTRKELLVATRHLLNSEFRAGFFRHIDPMLDERVLMGMTNSHSHRSDPTMIRPLAYTTLSDFVQHTRSLLSTTQMSKVVCLFSRVLHDSSLTLPLSTQYTAVRTLLSIVDLIFHNKDPDGQLGRDMLVRILETLVDKLQALVNYFPLVLKEEMARKLAEAPSTADERTKNSIAWLLSDHHTPADSIQDVQSMIRAIIMGTKTLIYYISKYRSQRAEMASKDNYNNSKSPSSREKRIMPPSGSNEEVSSALLKITNSEVAVIDRYIPTAIPAMKVLTETGTSPDKVKNAPGAASKESYSEKNLLEQHRDALTYFAAAFTALDGYNLRRTLGNRLDLLVDAIVDDPVVMCVPRHLLGSNPTTSFEFCNILLNFLVERMDDLCSSSTSNVIFIKEHSDHHNSRRQHVRDQLHDASQLPADNEERKKHRSSTMLQLFERVLKSLNPYPENEVAVRRHLRRIVVFCLRSSMENIGGWPENYCMLLRYMFRSISHGKFEESYKELLPLIPAVLNGLYRVVTSCRDVAIRSTAIELCLTIPARLSSLLPHMNLLLRIIIPALDSDIGDLINLGLRTLEFWVDNLNPLFLYPEMSKKTDLFTELMQALSRHLRPAPYPYGLLTLRLLGKLGGKNRQFFREPMEVSYVKNRSKSPIIIECRWRHNAPATSTTLPQTLSIELPVRRCLDILRAVAATQLQRSPPVNSDNVSSRIAHKPNLWENKIEDLDLVSYSEDVARLTKNDQAVSAFRVLRSATRRLFANNERGDIEVPIDEIAESTEELQLIMVSLLFACTIEPTETEAWVLVQELSGRVDHATLSSSYSTFMSEPLNRITEVGLKYLHFLLECDKQTDAMFDSMICSLCERCCLTSWDRQAGIQRAICRMVAYLGAEWAFKYEVRLVNAALLPVKTVPRELSSAAVRVLRGFVEICTALYGRDWSVVVEPEDIIRWDLLSSIGESQRRQKQAETSEGAAVGESGLRPSKDVFRIIVYELASPQQLVRFAARFLLVNFVIPKVMSPAKSDVSFLRDHVSLIRRVLFSRSLRLLPLPHQVGVVEGLATIIQLFPTSLPLTDQHLLASLSELLKMASVADKEMSDDKLNSHAVDKDGYTNSGDDFNRASCPTHASALFYRRQCVLHTFGIDIVVPGELPVGVQLRVSTIALLHTVIKTHADPFFDADPSAPVGNIRPHVISLLFRSLVSVPLEAVDYAHCALRDVLVLSISPKQRDSSQGSKPQSRLPKELLQTCIRPVLLHLKDYTRLSVPLLRGLSRLLSLLSSWFNKTLGGKLLDHLQKWADPSKITSQKIWKEGDEPLVAAAIVDIFASLPHAAQFVEHLVKLCIKLEATLPSFKARFVESPYRRPLARYLNKHPQYTVSFFFPRLKIPMYSELFLYVLQLEDESSLLREYLSNKQCSVMVLNVCFERPLAIIRSEKSSPSASSKTSSLYIHGVGKQPTETSGDNAKQRPMNTEALELQHQGFRLVKALLEYRPDYFRDHNDIVRAFRWLWRSKGRYLRLQHEDQVPPRYHDESKTLALFLMSYAKSLPSEDLDILFELFRVFLQPSTSDFSFVGRFLTEMVTHVLISNQKREVVQRFFHLIAGDTNEDIKVLGIQFLIFPMLSADFRSCEDTKTRDTTASRRAPLADQSVIEKFVKQVIFHNGGTPINSGERLKVELLRLANLFIEYSLGYVEPYRKDLVKFCWGLLKSDDTSCKCWAYIVVSRLISSFDTPLKIVRQVYMSLLRFHQQEGRDLVRAALDILVPALPKRFSNEDFQKLLEQTPQVLIEEGNSIPQLAHICKVIVRNSGIFYPLRKRFLGYMISSLPRLGLPPNGPQENRELAVEVIQLLISWEQMHIAETRTKEISPEQADSMCIFLIRLKLLIAEVSIESKNSGKLEVSASTQDRRIDDTLGYVLQLWRPNLRAAPLEKLDAKDAKAPGTVLCCLELVSLFVKFQCYQFFSQNSNLVKNIISTAVEHGREDEEVQAVLRKIALCSQPVRSLSSFLLVSLENLVIEANRDIKKSSSHMRGSESSRSRGRERLNTLDDTSGVSLYGLFAIELIAELCRQNAGNLNAIASTLLSFAKSLSKSHFLEAAAKQRQGSSSSTRVTAAGIRHHTPTVGILDGSCSRDGVVTSKISIGKNRLEKDEGCLSTTLRCLVIIMSLFESSDVVYLFSQNRKILLHITSTILESSDNVQLLMIAVRLVGKSILKDNAKAPLTSKERSSLLGRVAAFDFSNLSNDVQAHPLSDLVCCMVIRLSSLPSVARDDEFVRLVTACCISADRSSREKIMKVYLSNGTSNDIQRSGKPLHETTVTDVLWRLLHSDFEGLGSRFWVVLFVDLLMRHLDSEEAECIESLRALGQGCTRTCLGFFLSLLPYAWSAVPDDGLRVRLIASIETLLSKTHHSQFLRSNPSVDDPRCLNSVRTILNGILELRPIPVLNTHLLVSVAENYNCWYEVLAYLGQQYQTFEDEGTVETSLSAMRHCYRQLGERDMWSALACESISVPGTARALSLEVYGKISAAVEEYSDLVDLMEDPECELQPTAFEMDLWEERWILLQKELCQKEVVSEFAKTSMNPQLQLECAWKSQDWNKVRTLCASSQLFPAVESGDPVVKMSETLLAVADGKLSDVENLHAQTAQLCLYRWQLLPRISGGSLSHASLLHFFHRLVEIRESGQIMTLCQANNQTNGRSLPDLKNLLNAWRHRLPNDWEDLSLWDEIFSWRAHMFSAITSNFHWSEPDTLATLHDRPWTAIRMAKTARKQGMRDVSMLLLNTATDERALNVSDAFLRLREQILAYYNPESSLERHGGLNLINMTNLSFFDESQKSELFRLKASFFQSLQGRSKSNQAYCHAVQICPSHARAWNGWGELCSSLGAVTEKQLEQGSKTQITSEAAKETAKKVRQYLAQAMGCYLEAVQIDAHEWSRLHLAKCIWMLAKDGSAPGLLCQTFESRGYNLNPWVWLPWIPQLLTSLYRREGRVVKSIFSRLVKAYPQAVYYPLRAFYLERRDADRAQSSSNPGAPAQHQGSVSHAEELMSLLRKSHASLWSSLESVLEELIVKFRPSYEEELLATIIVLLERAEVQVANVGKKDDEEAIVSSVWKTLGKIAAKFFRPTDPEAAKRDARAKKTAHFKATYKSLFETDFQVSSEEHTASAKPGSRPSPNLRDVIDKLRGWKRKLEEHILNSPPNLSLIGASYSLAMFGVDDAPDLWPGACDPYYSISKSAEREHNFDTDPGTTQSTTSSSAAAARKAAKSAAAAAEAAAKSEGVGGDYGGGSSWIEIPGQYTPNTSSWTDMKPSPELHAKLVKFEPAVAVIRRGDALVRRIGMIASDGKTYYFLLQFAVPYLTRTDERMSQTHFILDKVLRKANCSSRAQLSVQPHPVIPVAQRLRLIGDTGGRTSLEEVYRAFCDQKKKDHAELPIAFNDEVKKLVRGKWTDSMTEKERKELERATRLDVYSKIRSSDGLDDFLLLEHVQSRLEGQEPLYYFRRTFAQQWAANCLLQYTFSASERTPSKVVFDYTNGRVLAPEFRLNYNNQGLIESQCAPFRLTPNLVNLVGMHMLTARFVHSMACTSEAVHTYRHDLDPIFRLLMRDDLVAFYTKSMAKSDAKTFEMEKQLGGTIARNVSVLHTRFAECSPIERQPASDSDGPATKSDKRIDQRVLDLVEAASKPQNLCMMSGSFQGWL